MKISCGAGAGGEGAECVHEWIGGEMDGGGLLRWEWAEIMEEDGFVKIDHWKSAS